MPFDGTSYNPWRDEPPMKPKPVWKETLCDMTIQALGLVAALTISAFVSAALDGFPPVSSTIPPPPDFPAASLLAQAGSLTSFFFIMAALFRWQFRKFFKEINSL